MKMTPLKMYRQELGIPQWELAKSSGISESMLSRIETGRLVPSTDVARLLAQTIGVTEEDLWGEGAKKRISSLVGELRQKSELPPKPMLEGVNHE